MWTIGPWHFVHDVVFELATTATATSAGSSCIECRTSIATPSATVVAAAVAVNTDSSSDSTHNANLQILDSSKNLEIVIVQLNYWISD